MKAKARLLTVILAALLAQGSVLPLVFAAEENETLALSKQEEEQQKTRKQEEERRKKKPQDKPTTKPSPTPAPAVSPKPSATPKPTTTPAPTATPAPTIDGTALYNQYCAGCHSTGKKGRPASAIQTAINNNIGGMGSLSFLTPAQLAAIAAAP